MAEMAMIDDFDSTVPVDSTDEYSIPFDSLIAFLDDDCMTRSESLYSEELAGGHVIQDVFQQDGTFCQPDPPAMVDNLTGDQQLFPQSTQDCIGAADADREYELSSLTANVGSLNDLHYSNQPLHMKFDCSKYLKLFGFHIPNLQSWSKHPAEGDDKYYSTGFDSNSMSNSDNQELLRKLPDCIAPVDTVVQLGQFGSNNALDCIGRTENKDTEGDYFFQSSIQESGVDAEDMSSMFLSQSCRRDLPYASGVVDEIISDAARTSVDNKCSMPFMYSTYHETALPNTVMSKSAAEPKHSACNDTELILDQNFCSDNQVGFTLGRHSPVMWSPLVVQMTGFREAFSAAPSEQHFLNELSFKRESSTDSSSLPFSRNSFYASYDTSISQSYKKQKVLFKNETTDRIQACQPHHKYNEVSTTTMLKNLPRSYTIADDNDISILNDTRGSSSVPLQRQNVQYFPVQQNGFYDHYRPRLGGMRCRDVDERVTLRRALQDLSEPTSEASPPEGLLSVPLMKHQRIALSWMVQKETGSHGDFSYVSGGILADDQGLGKTISTIALILHERSPSSKLCPGVVKQENFEALNLDDDGEDFMSEFNVMKQSHTSGPSVINELVKKENPVMITNTRPAAGTLVVCPTSVLRQWADELQNKVTPLANLSFLVYHGSNRTKDPNELAKYDVVLTTYSIVTMEVPKKSSSDDDEETVKCDASGVESLENKKRKSSSSKGKGSRDDNAIDSSIIKPLGGTLARVNWFRVILDEAQSIKNHKTRVANSCWGLRAKRRWCLSGTPIQNAIDDLYSYFRFLRYEPYSDYNSFCSLIKTPISKNPVNGYKKLQAVLRTTMLRRTKDSLIDGKPIIALPPKTITLKKIEFSQEERAIYSSLEAGSREQYQAYAAEGTLKKNYANILVMLLRLRQACDHPLLVKMSSLEMAQKLPKETRLDLLNRVEACSSTCAMCNAPPEDAVVTTCGHVFCNQCICEHLVSDDNICPAACCEFQLNISLVFSKETLIRSITLAPGVSNDFYDSTSSTVDPAMPFGNSLSSHSSKMKAGLEILLSLPKSSSFENSNDETYHPFENSSDAFKGRCSLNAHERENSCTPKFTNHPETEKAIVFSQWTAMLNLFEVPLKDSGIQYRRVDGTMSIAARDKAVKDFKTIPEVTVIIMSLKAASLGLNMVEANHVVLLDLWWNPTTEDQAIDRAHRIGQTRPVTVSRLTVKDTVEDRILALQERKRKMVASAFGEDESGSRQTRLTLEDLDYLFMV